MAVVGFVVTAFDAQPEGLRVQPVAAQKRDIYAFEDARQRPPGFRGTLLPLLPPDQIERFAARAGQLAEFIPGVDRVIKAPRKPEHLGSRSISRMRIRIVEGAARRTLKIDAKCAGI